MKKQAVIIGAGQTGRGFIAPILQKNMYDIIFVDKNKDLVKQLNEEEKYMVSYFGNMKCPCIVKDFEAFHTDEERTLHYIANADIVTTSVYASHIYELISLLQKAILLREKDTPLQIICCENGVHVKQPLIEANISAIITEGIIFCTTLQPKKDALSLLCEDYPEIPIDGSVDNLHVEITGMPIEMKFSSLIQRKIYTYNFMSAVVAYLGDYLGYKVYGDAANDIIIAQVMMDVLPIVSRVIAKEHHITYEEQFAFTKRAIAKFQNKEIFDTISRNSIQVKRKLGERERILTPLRLAYEQHESTYLFELICASAIYFGATKEDLDTGEIFIQLQNMFDEKICSRIHELSALFQSKTPLTKIIKASIKEYK